MTKKDDQIIDLSEVHWPSVHDRIAELLTMVNKDPERYTREFPDQTVEQVAAAALCTLLRKWLREAQQEG